MSRPKVLISDPMSSAAKAAFEARGVDAVQSGKLTPDELAATIGDYDGLAVRSASKVTADLLEHAPRLKVVGRAGIGVDNIDVAACTARGIVVMNTPSGNAVTTAEHALAMMLSLARHIPQANATTHAGKWAKSDYLGMELTGKLLGIIGSGNIGSIVAQKALGFGMKVQAYDPFLSVERAQSLGIRKVELDELLETSDIVSLHVPKTNDTTNIISATALNRMKPGALLVNCARGGLVDELALKAALESGHLKGAALDVFDTEPAKDNPLFGLPNLVCTPHLGASTMEAQEKVAIQVAEQMADYLVEGSVRNALNVPNLTAEERLTLAPYLPLVNLLGAFVGQLTRSPIEALTVTYSGDAANVSPAPLTAELVRAMLSAHVSDVNAVNAREIARERGIHITEAREDIESVYHNRVTLEVRTKEKTRTVSGTQIQGQPRLVEIKGIKLESEFGEHMLFVTNRDERGVIGAIGRYAADAGINIANMHLGRREPGGEAISLVQIDAPISADQLTELRGIEHIQDADYLSFPGGT